MKTPSKLQQWLLRLALRRFLKGETMANVFAWLSGKKTYITGLVGAVTAVLSLIGANVPGVPVLDKNTAIQTLITALMGIFIRHGVSTSGGSK